MLAVGARHCRSNLYDAPAARPPASGPLVVAIAVYPGSTPCVAVCPHPIANTFSAGVAPAVQLALLATRTRRFSAVVPPLVAVKYPPEDGVAPVQVVFVVLGQTVPSAQEAGVTETLNESAVTSKASALATVSAPVVTVTSRLPSAAEGETEKWATR